MSAKEVVAGISVCDTLASLAVLEHHENDIELLFLDELTRKDEKEFWYLDLLDRFFKYSRTKINQVALALDAAQLTIIQCPLDAALNPSDRNEQIHWELSQYVKNYNPKEYINDVHVLDSRSQEGYQNVLVVSVKREVIFGLQKTLTDRGATLGVVDVNHFATDSAILRNHPENEKTACCSIGSHPSRIDASILRSGRMTAYRYCLPKAEDDARAFVKTLLENHPITGVYLYGTHIIKERERLVKSLTQATVAILNPFRRTVISRDFRSFTSHAPHAHRFSAAVGIALRKA